MIILAIDPGNTESGYVRINAATRRPMDAGKMPNHSLRTAMGAWTYMTLAVEMVASYGMTVGAEVFETCVWAGRFIERHETLRASDPVLVYRRDIKLHHCGSSKATDANITQALIDRFAKGERNRGKGTKARPGWFYGFSGDMWQAYALAVYVADTLADAAPGNIDFAGQHGVTLTINSDLTGITS